VRHIVLPLLLIACRAEPETGETWISPVDGKSDVLLDVPLRVHVGGLQLPPDYPLGDDFIRVVDIDRGGFVEGRILLEGDVVSFVPDGGWEPGRRYVWSVGELPTLERGPEHFFPESLYGEALFATTHELEVLEIVLHHDSLVCAVLSRDLDAITDTVTATLDDHPVELGPVMLHHEVEWLADAPPELLEQSVSVACFPELEAPDGASLRLWWGEAPSFQARLEGADLRDVLIGRRRAR